MNNSDYLYLRYKYKKVKRIIIIILITFPAFKIAFPQQVYITRTGIASFVSDAPLEVIKAESKDVHGAIDLADRSLVFTIDNKSFKGFNSALQQEHFYENYMETQLYSSSTFKGKIIEEIDLSSLKEQVVRAKGILDIHGVEQERIIKGTLKFEDNKLKLRANFTVLLEDHQIKIPKVVNQKIAETIEVSISADLSTENK